MLALTPEATGLLFVGVAALITAVTTMIVQLVTLRRGIEEVHVLVNSQLTDVTNRVSQLEAALTTAGLAVPPDPADQPGRNP